MCSEKEKEIENSSGAELTRGVGDTRISRVKAPKITFRGLKQSGLAAPALGSGRRQGLGTLRRPYQRAHAAALARP